MAVAPIVNRKADISQVVIASSSDKLDIATDIQTVGAPEMVDAQSVTAQQFAESIRN